MVRGRCLFEDSQNNFEPTALVPHLACKGRFWKVSVSLVGKTGRIVVLNEAAAAATALRRSSNAHQ